MFSYLDMNTDYQLSYQELKTRQHSEHFEKLNDVCQLTDLIWYDDVIDADALLSLDEFEQALKAKADIIMLDNFTVDDIRTAVERTKKQAKIEASGGINVQTLLPIAQAGVDYISIGALTKDCKAVDLSMRFV